MLQHNLLPLNVQRKLRNGETVIAESHPHATILWAEVLGPTAAAASGMAAAAPAAAGVGSSAARSLQEALRRISSQQQLTQPAAAAGAGAEDGAGVAEGTEAAAVSRSSSDAAAAAAGAVSRSSSGVGLTGGDVSTSLPVGPYSSGLSPAEAVVRLNSLYTTWEELCAKQVGGYLGMGSYGGIREQEEGYRVGFAIFGGWGGGTVLAVPQSQDLLPPC